MMKKKKRKEEVFETTTTTTTTFFSFFLSFFLCRSNSFFFRLVKSQKKPITHLSRSKREVDAFEDLLPRRGDDGLEALDLEERSVVIG